jgi:hypothetical protein
MSLRRASEALPAPTPTRRTRPGRPRTGDTVPIVSRAVTTSGDRALPSLASMASSLLVLVAAVGMDVVADEPPVHSVAVAVAAGIVGLGRFRLRRRASNGLHGVVVAINLAVLGQPAVHLLTKLAHLTTEASHGHVVPDSVAAVALHVAFALMVVAIAASEPACAALSVRLRYAVTHLRSLLARDPLPIGPPRPTVCIDHDTDLPCARSWRIESATRRGPPVGAVG